MIKNRKAFTMLELVFVIAVIGILSAVALPKLAATRDDATISKAKSTVAAIRNAIATERQKRILRGNYDDITDLAKENGNDKLIFDYFDDNTTEVLEYPLRSCKNSSARECWISDSDNTYTFRMPASTHDVDFTLSNNHFNCDPDDGTTGDDCKLLSE